MGKKNPYISKSRRNNWSELSTFFIYSEEIRKLIYTTNPKESFKRGVRKVIKNRAIFPGDEAAFKLLYFAVNDISRKCTQSIRNRGVIFSQLSNMFENRLGKYI